MISPRFNLIEQLNIISAAKPSRESVKNMNRSFSRGDIPDTFRRMYEVANSLAAREGLIWVQVKHKQDMLDKMRQAESSQNSEIQGQNLPPLLEEQLYDFVVEKREDYMKRMTQLLELYAKSGLPRELKHEDK